MDYHRHVIVIKVRRVLSWWHTRQPTPCRVWLSQKSDKAVQSGHWVGKVVQTECRIAKFAWAFCWGVAYFNVNVVQTYKRRLLDAVFETSRILQIQNPDLNVATVDVPGVIYPTCGDLVSMDCTFLVQIELFNRSFNGNRLFISAWALTLSVHLD